MFGLRRAFQVAGVHTVIMSLWRSKMNQPEWMQPLRRPPEEEPDTAERSIARPSPSCAIAARWSKHPSVLLGRVRGGGRLEVDLHSRQPSLPDPAGALPRLGRHSVSVPPHQRCPHVTRGRFDGCEPPFGRRLPLPTVSGADPWAGRHFAPRAPSYSRSWSSSRWRAASSIGNDFPETSRHFARRKSSRGLEPPSRPRQLVVIFHGLGGRSMTSVRNVTRGVAPDADVMIPNYSSSVLSNEQPIDIVREFSAIDRAAAAVSYDKITFVG